MPSPSETLKSRMGDVIPPKLETNENVPIGPELPMSILLIAPLTVLKSKETLKVSVVLGGRTPNEGPQLADPWTKTSFPESALAETPNNANAARNAITYLTI